MNFTIKRPGPLVSPEQQYKTSLGTFTRLELYDKYAQTVQGCLCYGASDYAPYYGSELIMRAVIAMLNPSIGTNNPEFAFQKLEIGLNSIGYKLVPDDGRAKPITIIPQLYLGLECRFPNFGDQYKDDKTGKTIGGHRGLLRYLDIIDTCLQHSEQYQYDRAVRFLVQAVRVLADPNPDQRTAMVESLLWRAAEELGCRLDVVEWYMEMFPEPQT